MCGSSNKVKETEEERALAEIGAERWERYKQKFVPVENMAIDEVVGEFDNPSEAPANMANVSTQMQFSDLESQFAKGLTARGARPGSGAFEGGISGINSDRAKSSSLGQASAMGLQKGLTLRNLQNLVQMGQGQASGAIQGLTAVADQAQQRAIMDARASAASRAALGQAAGTAAGIGYGIYDSSYIPTATAEDVGQFGLSNPDVEWQQLPGT